MADEHLRAIFDEDAELYDRARPRYPAQLFNRIASLADVGPGARVVEIGSGTGQATRALAERGGHVVAVEMGPDLARVLRRNTAEDAVEVVVSSFEDWTLPTEPFDTCAAFTSWHWLDPAVRAGKAAAALRPSGALVTVTTFHVLGGSEAFFGKVQECYERWDPATPPGLRLRSAEDIPPARDEVDRSELFGPATRHRYRQDITYTTARYLDTLATYSGHRALEPARRQGLFECIARLIDEEHGGEITKAYLHELRVAHTTTRP